MPGRRTSSGSDREILVIQTALRLLEKQEWASLTLGSIARAARLPLVDLLGVIPSKSALPEIILRWFARETMRRHRVDRKLDDPRERVFDATMTFFDVQKPQGVALRKLYRALQYDLPTLLATRNVILQCAGELLALAEADSGLSARVQAGVFAGILVRAIWAWRADDDEMGKTMAQLDRDLRRAERFLWPGARSAGDPPASKRKRGRSERNSRR